MKKGKKNGKLLFFEKQDNDKLIYEQKKVHVFMLYFIDVDQGKEYTNSCRREIEKSIIICPSSSTGSICFNPPYLLPIPAAIITKTGFFMFMSSFDFHHIVPVRDFLSDIIV